MKGNFKKLSKRALALVLSLVMCLGMLPGVAYASEDTLTPPSETSNDGIVTISKTAERTAADEWKVTMTVTPSATIQTEPMELVILLDDSGSMNLCTGVVPLHEHDDEDCELTCDKEEHTHYKYSRQSTPKSCYELICKQEESDGKRGHKHNENCYGEKLLCQKTEHTHSASCYECGLAEHTHSSGSSCSLTNADYRLSRKYIAATKAQELVQNLYNKGLNVKVSIVTFATGSSAQSTKLLPLTTENLETIKGQIHTYVNSDGEKIDGQNKAGGWTNMAYGLHTANNQFSEDPGQKVIVMLADGDKNGTDPIRVADIIRGSQDKQISIATSINGDGNGKDNENLTAKGNSAQIYTIGFATEKDGSAETRLKGVAGQDDHFYRADDSDDLDLVFTQIAAKLTAMVQDDMGSQVNVALDKGFTVTGTTPDGSPSSIKDPDPSVTDGILSWNAKDNTIPAGETRTITYTVKLDTTLDENGNSKITVGPGQEVKLNGDAVLTYKVGAEGNTQTLAFPLPTDTIDYGTLDQTFVTVENGNEVALKPMDHQGKAYWDQDETSKTFTVTKPEDITVQGENGAENKVYHYIRSEYVDDEGNNVSAKLTADLTLANQKSARTVKHIYSLDYTVSYEWTGLEENGTYYPSLEESTVSTDGKAPVDNNTYKTNDQYTVDSHTVTSVLYTKAANEHLPDTTYVNGKYTFSGWKLNGGGSVVTGQQTMASESVLYKGEWTKVNPEPFVPTDPPETPEPGVTQYGVTYAAAPKQGGPIPSEGVILPGTSGHELTDTAKYFDGQEVHVLAAPTGHIRDDAHKGYWEFSGWTLGENEAKYDGDYVAMAPNGLDFVGVWELQTDPVPAFTITKTATVGHKNNCSGETAHVGDAINYSIVVANTGTVPLTDVQITDTMSDGRTPDADSLKLDGVAYPMITPPYNGTLNLALGVGCSTEITYTYTVQESDKGATITNVVTTATPGYDPEGSTPGTETEVDLPGVSGVKKTVVTKNTEIPPAVAQLVDGRITYPNAEGKIEAKVGEQVTLLYAIELRGKIGDGFNVEEEADAVYIGSTLDAEVRMTFSYPAQYFGTLEHTTDTLYFTKTFTIEADPASPGHGKPLTNTVTAAGLAPDPDDTATTEVDLLYAVRYKYSTFGYVPANANPGDGKEKPVGTPCDYLTSEGYKEAFYKAGTTVTVAAQATAEGYTFSEWMTADVEGFGTAADQSAFVMPANDVTFTGSFAENEIPPAAGSYTIEYYQENLTYTSEDAKYTKVDSKDYPASVGDTVTALPDPGKYEGFTYNASVSDVSEKVVSENGATVFKLYYDRKSFTVSYAYLEDAPDGAADLTAAPYAPVSYKYGADVRIAPAASASGYRFIGWALPTHVPYADQEETHFNMPAEDVELNGWFIENQHDVSYTVEHRLVGAARPFDTTKVSNYSVGVSTTTLPVTAESIAPKVGVSGVGHFLYMDANVRAGDPVADKTVIRLFYVPDTWDRPDPTSGIIVNKTWGLNQAGNVNVNDLVTWTITVRNDSDTDYTGLRLDDLLGERQLTGSGEGESFTGRYDIWNQFARDAAAIAENGLNSAANDLVEEDDPNKVPVFEEETDPAKEHDPSGEPVPDQDQGAEFDEQNVPGPDNTFNEENVPDQADNPTVEATDPKSDTSGIEDTQSMSLFRLFHAANDSADWWEFDLYRGEMITFTVTAKVLAEDGETLKNTVAVKDPSDTPLDTDEAPDITVNYCTVNFWDNYSGSATPYATGRYYLGQDLSGPTAPTRTEAGRTWRFDGWAATPTGPVVQLPAKVTGNADYYAIWSDVTPATYTVTYLRADNTDMTTDVVTGYLRTGDAIPGAPSVTANYGYVLGGWRLISGTPGPDGNIGTTDLVYSLTVSPYDPYIPPYIPVTPPVTIPDTTTPLGPTPDDGTTIIDEDVPLAGAIGLNDTDHFAYIIGYDDDTVKPLNNITRAEVATIFFRLMTETYRITNWSTENSFTDVKSGDWFNNAISTCANAGALKGYSDGSFKPNASITRAEFAAIAARFLSDEYTDEGVGDFSDTGSHWAAADIRRAVKAGWIKGDGNKFNPDKPITRAEVMTMVNRMLDRIPDADHMLPTMKKWIDNPEGTWYYEAVQEATNEHDYERDELGVVETWTELLTVRDWKALEAEWAANGGASASQPDTQPAEGTEAPEGSENADGETA